MSTRSGSNFSLASYTSDFNTVCKFECLYTAALLGDSVRSTMLLVLVELVQSLFCW